MKTKEKKSSFISVALRDLPKFFSEKFKKDKMIQLENRLLFSSFWKDYAWRAFTLALIKPKGRITNKLRLAWSFQNWLYQRYRTNGITYVVKYLKAGQLAISRSIAGSPMTSLSEVEPGYIFPSLTKSGLPKFIPQRDRRAIAGGSSGVIRFWITLFSVYRVLQIPSKLKLKTITDPFNGSAESLREVQNWISRNAGIILKRQVASLPSINLDSRELLLSLKSSPSSAMSWNGMVLDAHILMSRFPKLLSQMVTYAQLTGNKSFVKQISTIGGLLTENKRWLNRPVKVSWPPRSQQSSSELYAIESSKGYLGTAKRTAVSLSGYLEATSLEVGQLAFKKEAAGKVRVFAMVDSWTQNLLNPLHQLLFGLLRKLPNDGTFNQDASFKRCIAKAKASGCSYGYDLSAATDRLPLGVQKMIISSLFTIIGVENPMKASSLWGDILVGRPYRAFSEEFDLDQSFHYSVGQPMGALSSWAMLAMTHHLIVQMAAHLSGKTTGDKWWDGYEVIGDDIQIFDHEVAKAYLSIMRGLGVEVNESKSVVSPKGTVVEFAKRLSLNGIDVSAISWRMLLSQNHFSGRVATALWMLRKGLDKTRALITIACTPYGDCKDISYLSTSVLALLTSLTGKKGITLESLLMGLVDEKGKLLPSIPRVTTRSFVGIHVPVGMFIKKVDEYFKFSTPISLWFSEHWVREEAVESLETYIKKQLNYEMALLTAKLCDSSYLRKGLVRYCSAIWPHNEENIVVLTGLQGFVDEWIWSKARQEFEEFLPLVKTAKELKLKGLLQPKHLNMMSLEKTLAMKTRLEGIVSFFEEQTVERREPIPNTLKIIKVLMKSLAAKEPQVVSFGDTSCWNHKDFLQDESTRAFAN